jgi:hypothetical protein
MKGRSRLQQIIGEMSHHGDKLDERMDFWVENFGSQAASWLVWTYRRQFRRDGACDFVMPWKTETPPWMRVALETLKRRPFWSVERIDLPVKGEKRFRITWHGWGTFKPGAIRVTTAPN